MNHWGEACLRENDTIESSETGDDLFTWSRRQLYGRKHRAPQLAAETGVRLDWIPTDTAVVQYLVFSDQLVAILLQHHSAEFVDIRRTSRLELCELVRGATNRLRMPREWNPRSEHLCNLRDAVGVQEIIDRLSPEVARLLIVPDNLLHHVPFSALPVEDRPLVARLPWAFLPGWRWTRRPARVVPAEQRTLCVAVGQSQLPCLARLPNAEREIDTVLEFTGDASNVLKHSAATHENVRSQLSDATLCHFACHGVFDPHKPHQSGMALHDAWLTIGDLQELSLQRLQLVVLGACWSGNLAILPGNEKVGLPFAFLENGAKSVISCLWEIDDGESDHFTRSFYRRLSEFDVGEALSRTQAEYYDRKSHLWAGYSAYLDGIVPNGNCTG